MSSRSKGSRPGALAPRRLHCASRSVAGTVQVKGARTPLASGAHVYSMIPCAHCRTSSLLRELTHVWMGAISGGGLSNRATRPSGGRHRLRAPSRTRAARAYLQRVSSLPPYCLWIYRCVFIYETHVDVTITAHHHASHPHCVHHTHSSSPLRDCGFVWSFAFSCVCACAGACVFL